MNIHEEALQRYPVNSQPNGVSWTDASGFKREAFVAGAEWARKEALAEAAVELAAVRARRVKERDALVRRIWAYRGERDTLRAQLDGMTTEERSTVFRVNPKGKVDIGPLRYEQRLVGPWVEVTES